MLQAYLRDSPQTLDTILDWARAHAARAAARRAARQGRLLGPRGRRGAPARLERAGLRAQGRLRRELRGAHGAAARGAPARARRDRLAQPALGRPRDRRATGCSAARRRDVEFQVLRGLGDDLGQRARGERAARARLLPRRRPRRGMAYLVRRLLENTANDSFLADQAHGVPLEQLLAAPRATRHDRAPAARFATSRCSSCAARPSARSSPSAWASCACRCACRSGSAASGATATSSSRPTPAGPSASSRVAASATPQEAAAAVAAARARVRRLGRHAGRRARRRAAARRRLDARAPRRARRARGARVREALAGGRRRRLRGDRLPRVLRARRARAAGRRRARRCCRCPASATSCATRRAASAR